VLPRPTTGEVCCADSWRVGPSGIGQPSFADEPSQVVLGVPGPRRGLRERQTLVGVLLQSALNEGSRPFNCPCALLVAKAVAQLGGLGADFGECTLQRVHSSLPARRPAVSPSGRRSPFILYSAISAGEE